MKRRSGALRIFFYNWPVYVTTWAAGTVVLVSATQMSGATRLVAMAGASGAIAWSIASLVVSSYIYDHSPLLAGAWLPGLLGAQRSTWATVHAGLDAEIELDAVMLGECVARLDVFDPDVMTSSSIVRARARTGTTHASIRCSPTALALDDASCDALVVAFTAHEIRDRSARAGFFGEIRRALRPGGRAIVVEHFRDLPNFLAFGVGFVHFVARREWLSCAARADLDVAMEKKVTPWVTALVLERPR